MSQFICPRRPLPQDVARDKWRYDGSCTFCGSANPQEVMQALRDGMVELAACEVNYKVNLFGGKYRYNSFYFQHLSKEEMLEFISLFNQDKVKLQYPGYFYRMPFFMTALTVV